MRRVDALWLIEHVAREFDVATAVSHILQKKYKHTVAIKNFYFDREEILKNLDPSVICHPFFYNLKSYSRIFAEQWPQKVHFNLSWEQIFYHGNTKAKTPSGDFARLAVFHHAWGDFYKKFLKTDGISDKQIFLNGNPAYQLYVEPYRQYFKKRDDLARQYHIPLNSTWVLIPENYRWAFVTDEDIQQRAVLTNNEQEMYEMRTFCQNSLKILFQWSTETCRNNKNVSIIFRPKPANNSFRVKQFYEQSISGKQPSNFYIIKNETVRDWILAADIMISSFSTTLMESAIAEKPTYMFEPIPIPPSLANDWYTSLPSITTEQLFKKACTNMTIRANTLSGWVNNEMLSHGDAIMGLAQKIHTMIENPQPYIHPQASQLIRSETSEQLENNSVIKKMYQRVRQLPKQIVDVLSHKTERDDHENDIFSQTLVDESVARWSKIINI